MASLRKNALLVEYSPGAGEEQRFSLNPRIILEANLAELGMPKVLWV